MGLFGNKDKKPSAMGMFVSGLEGVPKTAPCRITLNDNNILVEEVTPTLKGLKALKEFTIPTEQIISIEVVNEENIKELSKSVLGRGIAGGVIFGPAGMILGGMSGIGSKQKKEKKQLLCISYGEEEIKTIIIEQYPNKWDMYDLVKEYKKQTE